MHTWGDKDLYNHRLNFLEGKTIVTNSLGHDTTYYHKNGLVYNQEGELIWEREQDLYSNSRQGFAKENFRCPFKYQGQYYDSEVELCYNRFRYYHPETGLYISEDPIGELWIGHKLQEIWILNFELGSSGSNESNGMGESAGGKGNYEFWIGGRVGQVGLVRRVG